MAGGGQNTSHFWPGFLHWRSPFNTDISQPSFRNGVRTIYSTDSIIRQGITTNRGAWWGGVTKNARAIRRTCSGPRLPRTSRTRERYPKEWTDQSPVQGHPAPARAGRPGSSHILIRLICSNPTTNTTNKSFHQLLKGNDFSIQRSWSSCCGPGQSGALQKKD